jgi:pSer/pThr/pTyr-binding forkhead associated (FHA) protein
MQQRLALKHLTGSRANKVERLALPAEREIVFGRDPGCHVRYDEADDLVSRKHLKIVATDEEPVRFMVVDLGSRNGTFVNRQKVFGAVLLTPGEHVQLGAGGPEFEFGLEHEPKEDTRQARRQPNSARRRRTRFIWVALAMLCLVATAAAGAYAAWPKVAPLLDQWRYTQKLGTSAEFDAAAVRASIADVLVEWTLAEKSSGTPLAQAYVPNSRISQGANIPLLEDAPATLPAFILSGDGRILPVLVPAGSGHPARQFAGGWHTKGVVASTGGAVLAGAPLQPPWSGAYRWPPEDRAGALLVIQNSDIVQVAPIAAAQFPPWVPGEPGFIAEGIPAELRGSIRGRWLASNETGVTVAVSISSASQTLKARTKAQGDGIWLVEAAGSTVADRPVAAVVESDPGPERDGRVWVVGNEVEQATILDAPTGGLMKLRSTNCHEGAVVVNRQGRALGMCVPGPASPSGTSVAVPIERGVRLLKGGTHGSSGNL